MNLANEGHSTRMRRTWRGWVESPNVEYRLGGDGLGDDKLGSGRLGGNRLGGSGLGDRELDATDWGAAG